MTLVSRVISFLGSLKKEYGGYPRIEFYADGSGLIIWSDYGRVCENKIQKFDSIEELEKILQGKNMPLA